MSMTDKTVYKSEFDAWQWVHEMFPNKQWYLDHESSERAGYKTYRDTEEFYNYVCELGDRLEVNLKEGNQTINLWIERESTPKIDKYQVELDSLDIDIIKIALMNLSSQFHKQDISDGTFTKIDSAIVCLNLVKKLNEITKL